MRYGRLAIAVMFVAALTGTAGATAYTWANAGGGGDWMTNANWAPGAPAPDYATYPPGDTFALASGDYAQTVMAANEAFGAQLTIGNGATLGVSGTASGQVATASNLILGDVTGGATVVQSVYRNLTLAGAIRVDNSSTIRNIQGDNMSGTCTFTVSANMSGSGDILSTTGTNGYSYIKLTGTNSGYQGDITVRGAGITEAASATVLGDGTGTVTIEDGARLRVNGVTYTGQVNVAKGGRLEVVTGSSTLNNVHVGDVNGAATIAVFGGSYSTYTLGGNIALDAAATLENFSNMEFGYARLNVTAPLTGTQPLAIKTIAHVNGQRSQIALSADNSAFSGAITVTGAGITYANTSNNALGTGQVTVQTGATLSLAGATFNNVINYQNGSTMGVDGNCTVNNVHIGDAIGGATVAQLVDGANYTLSGTLNLDNAATIQNLRAGEWGNSTFTIAAALVGDDPLSLSTNSRPASSTFAYLTFSTDHSGFSGDVTVTGAGKTFASSANALGSGNIVVSNNGWLSTTVNGALNSVFLAGHTVSVRAECGMQFASTEMTVGTPLVNVDAGGALLKTAGATNFIYSGGTKNVALTRGAILDASLGANVPARADVLALPGSGFGLYLGRNGAVTDNSAYSFGNDGATTIYRGLAAIRGATLTYTGVATDTALGQPGLEFYAQGTGTMTIGTTTVGATLSSNKLTLKGGGNFVFAGSLNTLPASIDQRSTGMVRLANTNSLGAGKTLDVNSGYLDLNAADAIGGTVNINAGGAFAIDIAPTSGAVTINSGGGVYVGSDAMLVGNSFTWNAGSQLGTYGDTHASAFPGGGKTNYLVTNYDYNTTISLNADVMLGDGTRVMNMPTTATTFYKRTLGGTGKIVLDTANGATQGGLAALNGTTLTVGNVVDFDLDGAGPGTAAGKLIIGDTSGTYRALLQGGTTGFADVATTGTVQLNNASNKIGSIEVRSGTLRVDAITPLGGATAFNVNGTLRLDYNNPSFTGVAFSGSGNILVGDNGSGTSTLAANGDIFAPGNSAGRLTIQGNVNFGVVGVAAPSTLEIEIMGEGNVAGVDYDQLRVLTLPGTSGNITGLNNVHLTVGGAAGLNLTGQTFDIVTYGGTISGVASFFDVFFDPGWTGQIQYDTNNKKIILYNVVGPTIGTVPEPAGLGLLGLALLALRRRRS